MDIKNSNDFSILILSRGFKAGDAITTLNLFSQWPKENLFCASLTESEYAKEVADFYFLGDKEVSYSFPFNHISHPSVSHRGVRQDRKEKSNRKKSFKTVCYEKFIRPVMQRLDLYETRFALSISSEFEAWIKEIKPDVIYTSVGDIAMAKFILEVNKKFPDIKIIIHGFDDWLSPSYRIIRESNHRQHAEALLKEVLGIASGYFSSTEMMAKEYNDRYGYKFTCFTNPARITASDCTLQPTPNIVFTGKIGWHNHIALRDMMAAVEEINSNVEQLYFDIFTDTPAEQIENFLGSLPPCTRIHPPVPNTEIPDILASAHVVYLPISIDIQTAKFTRYSMSTKMGEYLASGTPMIYYGPDGIAMTEFLKGKDCAQVVTKRGKENLILALNQALHGNNEESLKRASAIANQYFNADIVSRNFKDAILSI